MGFFFLVVLWILCGLICGMIADDKGHGGEWFFAGLCLGPVGFIAIAALSDRKQRRYLRLLVEHQGIDLAEATEAQKTLYGPKTPLYKNVGTSLRQKILNELKR